jgi:hypothetical protein
VRSQLAKNLNEAAKLGAEEKGETAVRDLAQNLAVKT